MSVNLSTDFDNLPFSPCYILRPSSWLYTSFFITNIMVLSPLCIFIYYLGLKQWRHQQTSSTAAISHTDWITFHMVTMELICVFGYILCCFGIFTLHITTYTVGYCLWTLNWYGEMYFHILTSMERYLAVVHPITYRNLRSEKGVRIRNICIGLIWLLSTAGAVWITAKVASAKLNMTLFFFAFIFVFFCSLSVLHALIRPGPGERGREREKFDQSKLRAFFTIVAILGVLLLRFAWNVTWASLYLSGGSQCILMAFGVWFAFPSSLVLLLLFLHRQGVCSCFRKKK